MSPKIKIFLRIVVLPLAVIVIGEAARYVVRHHTSPATETDEQIEQAAEAFDQWCDQQQRPFICFAGRDNIGSAWTVRFYNLDKPDVLWEESGYPRLSWAVQALIEDHYLYRNGHIGGF